MKVVFSRMLGGNLIAEDIGFGLCARQGYSGLQTAHERQRVSPPVRFVAQSKRRKKVDVRSGSEDRAEIKVFGHDSHDRYGSIVQANRFAYDLRIAAKTALP